MIINSSQSLNNAYQSLKADFERNKYLILTVRKGYNRTLAQNRLQQKWFSEMEEQSDKSMTRNEWRAYCKYHFGFPIMERDPDIKEMLDSSFGSMSYEKKLKAIEFFDVPVSRNFTRDEMKEYLDAVYHFGCFDRGFMLTNPKEYEK